MRRTLSAAAAKNRLSDALRQAENGDLVIITRYRQPGALEQLQPAGVHARVKVFSTDRSEAELHRSVTLADIAGRKGQRHR